MGYESASLATLSDGGFGATITNKYAIYDNSDYYCDFCVEFDNKRRVSFFSHDLNDMGDVTTIEQAVSKLKGTIVDVNLTLSAVEIIFSPKTEKLSRIVEAIETKGYTLVPDKALKYSLRHDLMRIGMAGFCFLNIMLFSAAEYLQGDIPMAREFMTYFHRIQLALSIPIVFYSAFPLIRSSYQAARNKRFVIDQPIIFAIFSAFTYSAHNVLTSKGNLYFDSVAAVTFLMLTARFFQKKYLEQAVNRSKEFESISNTFIKVRPKNSQAEFLKISKADIGQEYYCEQGDTIPLDSTFTGNFAQITLEQITGEPEVITKKEGDVIKSGSKLVSTSAQLVAIEKGVNSYIYNIRKTTEKVLSDKSQIAVWTDHVASAFFAVVMVAAAVCFYIYRNDLETAFANSVAMLLVACPCSFAIAVPLAHAKALVSGIRNNVAFKNTHAIDKLASVKAVILDKTGTLTIGRPIVSEAKLYNSFKSHDALSIISSLAPLSNHHSVNSALDYLKKENTQQPEKRQVSKHSLFTGAGITAVVNGLNVALGSASFNKTNNAIQHNLFLKVDGELAASFKLSDALHPTSKQVLQNLKDRGKNIFILSGDTKDSCLEIGEKLGVDCANIYFEKTPEQKQNIVEELSKDQEVAMVGDGVNDTLALSSSCVGINVSASSNFLKEKSDISLMNPGLEPLSNAVSTSNQTRVSLYSAFSFAALYNTSAIALAFMGYISPIVAAVTMPINSVVVSYLAVAFIKDGGKK